MSHNLTNLAKNLWMWCLERNIHIIAQHLPGILNTIANVESRTMVDQSDWELNEEIFQSIDQLYGPIEVDLFASSQCHNAGQICMQQLQMHSFRIGWP